MLRNFLHMSFTKKTDHTKVVENLKLYNFYLTHFSLRRTVLEI